MFKAFLAFILLVAVAAGAWFYLRPEPPVVVDVIVAERSEIATSLQLTGQVVNDRTVSITALLDGEITGINARQGDAVAAGAVLASLDNQVAIAQVTKAEAELAYQRRHLQIANSNYNRTRNLLDKGSGTQQAVDDRLLEKRRVEAAFKVAEADLAIRQLQMKNAEIKAPFAGTIIQQQAEVGQWVEAGTQLFVLVADDGQVVEMLVDAGDATKVVLGQRAELSLEADPDSSWENEVIWIAPSITASGNSNALAVRVSMDGVSGLLLDQQVDVELELARREDVVVLQQAALLSNSGEYYVLLENNGVASRQSVEPGIFSVDTVEILKGLDAGDRVILPGLIPPKDGQAIETR